ncbi:MAG: aminotransferase class IV [Opitutaceae bacterium]|jgi:branched-chain amino acid aminotransferase|nr:aminotransferase class IV [Opitutaceae bacterium]
MTLEYVQANTDGVLHDAAVATVSPLNRGFLYGDGIYEVWRTYSGVIFAWEEHWERLLHSAAALGIEIPWNADVILKEIQRTVQAYRDHAAGKGELYIRLQISRGEGEIGLDSELADRCRFVILVKQLPALNERNLEVGARLSIAQRIRRNPIQCLDPAWKTGNYLNNIVGLREAKERRFDDVVFLNLRGELTEASTSNLAFIKSGKWITPPTAAGILHGITRAHVIAGLAERADLAVEERMIRPEELADFDEAMLLSTTKDVQPVGCIDDVDFQTGPGTATRILKEAFVSMARDYATAHPQFQV